MYEIQMNEIVKLKRGSEYYKDYKNDLFVLDDVKKDYEIVSLAWTWEHRDQKNICSETTGY